MLKHWIWLSQRGNISKRRLYELLQQFGSAESVYLAQKNDYSVIDGITANAVKSLLDKNLSYAEDTLRECAKQNISILTIADEEYPQRLKNIADPPCVLYYKGTIPKIDEEAAIAVVGTRRGTPYGLMCAKQFGVQLAGSGCMVISGGARGVDTMALRGAMNTGAAVVCVLGCGVDVAYPSENESLFSEIANNGWLVSEYEPGDKPLRANFPARNRIISGLSVGVLVVEAAKRSGALITAEHALDQGRDVFAVPGNIDISTSFGTNRLLKEGAIIARSGWDVASEYQTRFPEKIHQYTTSVPLEIRSEQNTVPKKHEQITEMISPKNYIDVNEILDQLNDDEKKVIMVLKNKPMHIDELVNRCSLLTTQTLVALTMLEVKNYIKRLPGRFFSLAEKQ